MGLRLILCTFCLIAFVSCDPQDESEETFVATQDVEIEVDYFEHSYDTDSNKEMLRYRITYTNPNDFTILGAPIKTLKSTQKEAEIFYTMIPFEGKTPCQRLEPGETCVEEESMIEDISQAYDPDDLPLRTLEKVEYNIREELR
ncbi:hypothetical protein [Leeuwenhoekiella nanhaiensis]|uniref:Uncharacterized protein n=1 Tax=Leeuwenhoekiella nanhaiensis TaxID=1655491 RepID=A0A2G1VSQ7_9FLAO|nr:hypothetical protein [Leeuwenhoekiella nanhaiensis]PHQ29781.1 hypothetical protein CJ305_07355 [Leeuwenhoekiella nanhaiensis]